MSSILWFSFAILFFLLMILNGLVLASQPVFSYASLVIDETQPLTPFDFTITFTIQTNITNEYPTTVLLPRFTRNLNANANFSASNISYSKLLISPSSIFEAEFLEGTRNGYQSYDYIPYTTSLLIVRTKADLTIVKNSTVVIKVFKENGIGAICGFPSFDYYNESRGLVKDFPRFSIQSLRLIENSYNRTLTLMNYTFDINDQLIYMGPYTKNVTEHYNFTIFVDNNRTFDNYTGIGPGCSNQCNQHGWCDFCYQTCNCYDGYGSANDLVQIGSSTNSDCSSRVCPAGKAIADMPTGQLQAHARAECSNRGNCDRSSGLCKCFPPFTGSACERMSCPNDCSGHGICVSMQEYADLSADSDPKYRSNNKTIVYGSANGMNTIAWDYNTMYACVCDSGWPVGYGAGQRQLGQYFGADCSKKRCPTGDDPYTSIDETNCAGISQISGVTNNRKGKTGNICQIDCSNRGICDYSTGICKCFEGSFGEACEMIANTGVHSLISNTVTSSFWTTDGNSSMEVVGN